MKEVKANKQEYSTLRAEQKIESHDAHLQLNPNAREFKTLPVGSTATSTHSGRSDHSALPGEIMDKVALTIKQVFALPKGSWQFSMVILFSTGTSSNHLKTAS